MKIINKIKCFFGFHKWGVILGLDPAKDSGLYQTTTKHCTNCPFIHSVVRKPVGDIKGKSIEMVVYDETESISDSQWEAIKKQVANNNWGIK